MFCLQPFYISFPCRNTSALFAQGNAAKAYAIPDTRPEIDAAVCEEIAVFSVEHGVTPYDIELIMAEYMA